MVVNIRTTDTPGSGGQPDAVDWSVLETLNVLQKAGKPSIRRTLITAYLTTVPGLLERAGTAVNTADGAALRSAAHSMKSSSMAIGAVLFGRTCAELELLGKSNTLEDAPALLRRAESELDATCSALREALEPDESDGVCSF
ncbi:MAG: Hpt domain-containing protein [Desulfuromonadales bacterium]